MLLAILGLAAGRLQLRADRPGTSVWLSGKAAVGSRLLAIDSGDPTGEVYGPGHFGWLVPPYAILAGLFALAGTLPLWWLTRLAVLPGIGGKRSFGAVPAGPGRHARTRVTEGSTPINQFSAALIERRQVNDNAKIGGSSRAKADQHSLRTVT